MYQTIWSQYHYVMGWIHSIQAVTSIYGMVYWSEYVRRRATSGLYLPSQEMARKTNRKKKMVNCMHRLLIKLAFCGLSSADLSGNRFNFAGTGSIKTKHRKHSTEKVSSSTSSVVEAQCNYIVHPYNSENRTRWQELRNWHFRALWMCLDAKLFRKNITCNMYEWKTELINGQYGELSMFKYHCSIC